jgi:hypothetical protein
VKFNHVQRKRKRSEIYMRINSMANTRRKTLREKQNRLSYLIENALEKTELVLAVKSITDKLQNMAENLAKINADDIMPMLDSLKTAFGPQVAQQFNSVATAKINELVTAISGAKDAIGNEVLRLEKGINGEPTNDMGSDLPPDTDMDNDMANDSMEDDMGKENDADMGHEDSAEVDDMPPLDNPGPMNAAGRAKKESAAMRGRKLYEYTSAAFDSNLSNLSAFDPRAGAMAADIHNLIDAGKFDGEERSGLANVLSHLASCADDMRHWEDPDAKLETALRAANVDVRLPDVRPIIIKLKKLAHLIGLKHDGMMESKKIANNVKALREASNPDAVIFNAFRKMLTETKNVNNSVRKVAETYQIDMSDVIAIIREGKLNEWGKVSESKLNEYFFYTRYKAIDSGNNKWRVFDNETKKYVTKIMSKSSAEIKAEKMNKEDDGGKVWWQSLSKSEGKKSLPFPVKAKKKPMKEASYEEREDDTNAWYDIIDKDTNKVVAKDVTPNPDRAKRIAKNFKPGQPLAEQQPLKPRTPADMRADKANIDARKAQTSQAPAPAQPQQPAPAPAQKAPMPAQKAPMPAQKPMPAQNGAAPMQQSPRPALPTKPVPVPNQDQQAQQFGNRRTGGNQNINNPNQPPTEEGEGQAPKPQSTPVGQTPQNTNTQDMKIPGQVLKPGAPLMSTTGGTGVSESKKTKSKDDPCWKNYKQVGMKKKAGKSVPNCVPESKSR